MWPLCQTRSGVVCVFSSLASCWNVKRPFLWEGSLPLYQVAFGVSKCMFTSLASCWDVKTGMRPSLPGCLWCLQMHVH